MRARLYRYGRETCRDRHIPIEDAGFEQPEACVHWCQARTYDLHILDDGASVDLDWWNSHLRDSGHEIQLRGRNDDGKIVTAGLATVQRNDLRLGSELVSATHDGLGLLFLCAAWQSAHRDRRFKRRFPDVFGAPATKGDDPLQAIKSILDDCLKTRTLPAIHRGTWSGRPVTPGVGVSLLAAFMWAAEVSEADSRTQLIDQFGASTVIHEGWLEDPAVSGLTLRRYHRYNQLLSSWATTAQTRPELIEMWLIKRWMARVQEARRGGRAMPTQFWTSR
ncbi:8-oxoguanine DNA glycosylase OGG fold protein [Rhodococcus sp. YL-1]|uniref:8-oxoguanine DNA glycosylase OGG fold protein n=1 Tax=Rhodococcus sp. YL-1 TaxID=1045808 RepID=UPI000AE71929